jgi:hypothetical protein
MAITLTDNRTIFNQADATTGWTGTATVGLNTVEPTPIEPTGRLEMAVSNAIQSAFFTLPASVNMSSGFVIYIWSTNRAEFDTIANLGVGLVLGDGTNRVAYGVGGSNAVGFAHSEGPVVWQCYAIDTGNLAAYSSTTIAGSAVNLNLSAITQVGIYFKTLVKAVGGAVNCFWDIGRYLDPTINDGCAITITAGTSVDPGTFEDIAAEDRVTTDQRAHGVVRKLGEKLYGIQGPLRFGAGTGTASTWFEDKNSTVAFEDRKFETDKYKIVLRDNGVGTTTFKLGTKIGTGNTATGAEGCSIKVPATTGALFDAQTDTNVTDVFIYGSSFIGFDQGIWLNNDQEFIANTVSDGGPIFPGTGSGAYLFNTICANLDATVASSSLYWDTESDVSGRLDGMRFTMGTQGSHAIELGTKTPSSISFSNITLNSYEGTPGTNTTPSSGPTGSAVYNNSGKAITINVSGGTIPSVRNGSGATTTIVSTVTITVTGLKDGTEVRVYETGTTTEVAGVETATDGTADDRSFTFSAEPDSVVDIVILSLIYENERINGYIIPSTNASIPIQQRIDRNYLNPPGP